MILLVDADSLVFASCYRPREDVDTFYTNLDDVIHKFDESFMKIVNDLSDKYEVKEVLTFNNSKGNFRKLITPTYKANRIGQKKPPMLKEMHDYVQETYDGIYGYGIETDDIVATYWKELSIKFGRENVMIVSIDKDYLQFPALIYRYNRKEILNLSEFDSLLNFYTQMIIGDTSDNVNYFKGKGIKFAQKYYKDCDTKYQFTKMLYLLFKERYRSKAREKYIECYNLLKLRTE